MSHLISISRRTDVPAFYGEWFMRRLEQGFAGWVNPYNSKKRLVSLLPQDVTAFIFWSKNFAPFIDALETIRELGYRFYFNFTLTGLPRLFEPSVVPTDIAIQTMRQLSQRYSPRYINWRYDPVVLSSITGEAFHLDNFARFCAALEGATERCYFSFPVLYHKVRKNLSRLEQAQKLVIHDPDLPTRRRLSEALADIATGHGITLYSCCGDILLSPKVHKAHCIDGNLIAELFDLNLLQFKRLPTRTECGCTASIDIGAYDTCAHGCAYCYADVDKTIALAAYRRHDPESAFLGYGAAESDAWVEALWSDTNSQDTAESTQLNLFDPKSPE